MRWPVFFCLAVGFEKGLGVEFLITFVFSVELLPEVRVQQTWRIAVNNQLARANKKESSNNDMLYTNW